MGCPFAGRIKTVAYLYDELIKYRDMDYYPFHMPGHKRRLGGVVDPVTFDITEIEGFDNLHHAEGLILEAQKRAAGLYGAEETHFLVNGSTGGILSAIGACAPSGKLLMSRNSHKAAYHGVFINRLEAVYLYPEKYTCDAKNRFDFPEELSGEWNGPVRAEEVRAALQQEAEIRAVFLTSPTYDGVISDVRAIAQEVHKFDIPLIVDAAHGAHFGMHPDFPENAAAQEADIVIHSLHKTLPSLTQTALLHVNGDLVDRKKLRKMLDIYQTSSPSYVLMASMDECIRMLQVKGTELFETFARRLRGFWEEMRDLKRLNVFHADDPSKIIISAGRSGLSGMELAGILRETYHIEPEMAAGSYVLALASVGDDEEGFSRLAQALRELDRRMYTQAHQSSDNRINNQKEPLDDKTRETSEAAWRNTDIDRNEICMTIAEAEMGQQRKARLEDCENHVSGEYIYLYPPGIPLIVPGERMKKELLHQLLAYRERGYSLQGMEDYEMKYLRIMDT